MKFNISGKTNPWETFASVLQSSGLESSFVDYSMNYPAKAEVN